MALVKGREREGFGGRGFSDFTTYTGHGLFISPMNASTMSEKIPAPACT